HRLSHAHLCSRLDFEAEAVLGSHEDHGRGAEMETAELTPARKCRALTGVIQLARGIPTVCDDARVEGGGDAPDADGAHHDGGDVTEAGALHDDHALVAGEQPRHVREADGVHRVERAVDVARVAHTAV